MNAMLTIVKITTRNMALPVWHWLVTLVHSELTAQASMKSRPGPQVDDGGGTGLVITIVPLTKAQSPVLSIPAVLQRVPVAAHRPTPERVDGRKPLEYWRCPASKH